MDYIIGASLSEPHIDRDNVPCRGECLYICSAQTGDLDHPSQIFPHWLLYTSCTRPEVNESEEVQSNDWPA